MPLDNAPFPPRIRLRPAAEITTRMAMKAVMSPSNGWPAESLQQGVVHLRSGVRALIFISDPALARDLLAAPQQVTRDPIYLRAFGIGQGPKSLTTTIGQEWRDLRHALAPIFRPAGLARMLPVISALTQRWLGDLARGSCPDLQAAMNGLTLQVIHQTIFGTAGQLRAAPELRQAGQAIAEAARQKSLAKAIGEISALADWVVADPPEIPMIPQNPFARSTPNGLSAEERLFNARMILDAGHETTATHLTWILFLLGQRPEWQARLRAEILRGVGQAPILADALDQMPLLRATMNEVLRLYPSAPIIFRRILSPFALRTGEVLPGDAHLAISLYALQRRPEFWDRPDEFLPERWLDAPPNPAFLPFGAGIHKCIGMGMSLMQIAVVLTEILRATAVETLTEDVQPAMLVTLHPDRPVAMHFHPLEP